MIDLNDSLFMKGGNTDEQKKYYSTGYISGLQDSGMVKALEQIRDGFDHDNDAHRYNNLPACRVCIATKALAGINETKEK